MGEWSSIQKLAQATEAQARQSTLYSPQQSALVNPTLGRITSMLIDRSMEGSVCNAEICMAGFISEQTCLSTSWITLVIFCQSYALIQR